LKRIVVNDATHEKLHEILSENPSGVLVIRDELTGWLSSLDKPGREDARTFFLQAWNGNSSFTRGPNRPRNDPCLDLLGGVQPARLRSYLAETIRDGPGNDGLMQRFQLLVWPDLAPWKGADRLPDTAAAKRVEHAFRSLVRMDPETPARFKFSPDAQNLFNDWRETLETKKLRGTDDHPALIAHLGKYRSLLTIA